MIRKFIAYSIVFSIIFGSLGIAVFADAESDAQAELDKIKGQQSALQTELDKGKGPVATVLVQKGTLHVGDSIKVRDLAIASDKDVDLMADLTQFFLKPSNIVFDHRLFLYSLINRLINGFY